MSNCVVSKIYFQGPLDILIVDTPPGKNSFVISYTLKIYDFVMSRSHFFNAHAALMIFDVVLKTFERFLL